MIDEPLEDDDGIDDLLATEALAPSAPRTGLAREGLGRAAHSSSLFGDQEARRPR